MRKARRIGLLLVIFVTGSAIIFPARVNAGIQVTSESADLSFPGSITFSLSAYSPSSIDRISLQYWAIDYACPTQPVGHEFQIHPASKVNVNWKWEINPSLGLPPGAHVRWQWVLQDDRGNFVTTRQREMAIEDPTLDWQTVQDGFVSITWANSSPDFGLALMDTVMTNLARIRKELGLQPAHEIIIQVYPSQEDIRRATTLELPPWAGSVAFPGFGIILVSVTPEQIGWAGRILPHEMTHLLVSDYITSCRVSTLPFWLSEGLSMVTEGPADRSDLRAMRAALAAGEVDPLRDLTVSSPTDLETLNLAYTVSGEVVHYLLDTYGTKNLLYLFNEIRSGKSIDTALSKTYGSNTDGIDLAWRTSLGFAE